MAVFKGKVTPVGPKTAVVTGTKVASPVQRVKAAITKRSVVAPKTAPTFRTAAMKKMTGLSKAPKR